MKKSIILSVFAFLFFSVSASFAQDDLLLGKWKIDKIVTKKIYDYANQIIENPELITDEKPQEIIDEENSIQVFIDKGSFLEIKPKNVYILGLYNFIADEILPIKTTWYYMNEDKKAFNIAPQETKKVVKNGKSSKLTARNSVDYTIYQIIKLSEDKLMLFIEKENISYELSRVK
jgi:hypothetical protein